MANTTVRGAQAIHGQNPQFLVETVIRNRIYESSFWKEHCFALTAETLIDKSLELRCIGGVYGNQRPTEFLCLLLKLLQIQPEKEILLEYLQADEFKYLRALTAIYIRMTFGASDVYELLEPLLKDFRKLRYRNTTGNNITFIDDFVDQLLNDERVCDIILPRIPKRQMLEEAGDLGPRKSRLLDAMEGKIDRGRNTSSSGSRSRSRSGSRSADEMIRGRGRSLSHSDSTASDAGSRYVSRSPSRSRSRSPSASFEQSQSLS
ncbi:hypothetical protein HETIRDRAFT_379633 [Heterobasidion irregulare TC 32-1]|uniref:Pre-mRNA-splicing factor 38 n=1 Tax=Heterobasidion irregulare (strain TC 32-1) TaxID=747525 RepID=W4KIC8_HETIT|nr:uncharacterized protein HETIRDRAFT_379633 [Heterobasidion irregulare TC 32-1]ETW85618.1 hypothetical protein HETIRDRAFT_379633 [Heterobasidion irregulare TC 32-1]